MSSGREENYLPEQDPSDSNKRVARRGSASSATDAQRTRHNARAEGPPELQGIVTHGISPDALDLNASALKPLQLKRLDIPHSDHHQAGIAMTATDTSSGGPFAPSASYPEPGQTISQLSQPRESHSARAPYDPVTVTVYRGETEYRDSDAVKLVKDVAEGVNEHLTNIIKMQYGSTFPSSLHTYYKFETKYRSLKRTTEELDCILGLVNIDLRQRQSIVKDIDTRVREHGGPEDTKIIVTMFKDITDERKKIGSLCSQYKASQLAGTEIKPLPTLYGGVQGVVTQDFLDEEFYHLCICAESTLKHLKKRVSDFPSSKGPNENRRYKRLIQRFGNEFRDYKEALGPSGNLARAYKHDLDGKDMPRISSDLQTLLEPSLENFKSMYNYKDSIPW
jgi:hypothetical protein